MTESTIADSFKQLTSASGRREVVRSLGAAGLALLAAENARILFRLAWLEGSEAGHER